MKFKKTAAVFLCVCFLLNMVFAEENLEVLPGKIDGFKPNEMMYQYLRGQVREEFENWKSEYERRKSSQQISGYQKDLRQKFLEAIGGLGDERTPLNPQIAVSAVRDGYRVEKIIFESQPNFYVTGVLFLPDSAKYKPPYPGVLVPCGHYKNAKAAETYQKMGALLALNGMAGFVFDPIDQGERSQKLEDLPGLISVKAHNMIGIGSILLGRNTARFEIWDGMRAIDYLQSRSDIDGERIGCTGNSGGGTQTSYLMNLDSRIKAASPSCYITNMYERIMDLGPQDAEQNIYGQLGFGMDHADYLMMRAPMPILICAATEDFFDIEGTWSSFRYAKRLYTRMGFAERISLLENDAGHNYNYTQREGVVRWMSRWLLGIDKPIVEPPIKVLSDEEIRCTPQGQVMLMKGARSTYDLNRDYERQLVERRRDLWKKDDPDELFARVRKLAGIRNMAALPRPKVEKIARISRGNYHIEKLILKPEYGIYLSALLFIPEKSGSAVLYLNEEGKSADANTCGPIEELVKRGKIVLAVDVRGIGETYQTKGAYSKEYFGNEGNEIFMAYLLGRSYVGMRTEDILVCARWLIESNTASKSGRIGLIAKGNVSVPALHAAALEQDMFKSVKLSGMVVSWSNVIELGLSKMQAVNMVHGALTTYDLGNLADSLGYKLTIEEPVNALEQRVE